MTLNSTCLSLSAAMFLAACAADAPPEEGTGAPATSSTTSPPGSSTGEYSISCHGDIAKTSVSTSVSPRCVGGEAGTFGCGDPCAPQQIEVRYEPPATRCGSVDLFAWDGTACKAYPTNDGGQMKCKGADCEKLFATEAACVTAHETCPVP